MLLGILSDTHDQLVRTRLAVSLLRESGAEVLIHCGDLAKPEIVAACAVLPTYFVLGNWDADNVPALRKAAEESGAVCLGWGDTIILDGKRIGVVHGHMRIDVRRVMATKPHYLLSGHSHIAIDHYDGDVRRINPGALYDADQFTVAVLDLENDSVQFLSVPSTDCAG
jgi:putative phosphoesterase